MRLLLLLVLILVFTRPAAAQFYVGDDSVPDAAGVAKLIELLHSPEPALQYAALLALQRAYSADQQSLLAEIKLLLQSKQGYVRAEAVSVLASSHTPESLPLMLELLESEDARMATRSSAPSSSCGVTSLRRRNYSARRSSST